MPSYLGLRSPFTGRSASLPGHLYWARTKAQAAGCAPGRGLKKGKGVSPRHSPNRRGPSGLLPPLPVAPTDQGFTFKLLQSSSIERRWSPWMETDQQGSWKGESSPSQAFGCPDNSVPPPPLTTHSLCFLSQCLYRRERGWGSFSADSGRRVSVRPSAWECCSGGSLGMWWSGTEFGFWGIWEGMGSLWLGAAMQGWVWRQKQGENYPGLSKPAMEEKIATETDPAVDQGWGSLFSVVLAVGTKDVCHRGVLIGGERCPAAACLRSIVTLDKLPPLAVAGLGRWGSEPESVLWALAASKIMCAFTSWRDPAVGSHCPRAVCPSSPASAPSLPAAYLLTFVHFSEQLLFSSYNGSSRTHSSLWSLELLQGLWEGQRLPPPKIIVSCSAWIHF